MVAIAYVFAFLAAVLMVQAISGLVFSNRDRVMRVNRRLTMLDAGVPREKVFEALVRRKPGTSAISLSAPDLYQKFLLYFRQAGLEMSPARFGVFVAIAGVFICVAGATVLTSATKGGVALNLLMSILGGVVLAITGGAFVLSYLRTKRLRRLEEQLPLALEVVVRALRAGHPLIMAMKLAAEEMGDPLGSEFGLIVDENNYGLEFRQALENFAERSGSEYVRFFAVSVAIQSETGGNLAEILANLNKVIRDQQTLHLRVAALASEGKMSATVLTALPVVLISYLLLTQPTFYTSKFDDPIFWPTVGVTMGIYAVGQIMINRMVNFKY